MTLEDQIRGAVHRFHDELGPTIRLETHVETGNYDDHGHPITEVHDVETQGEVIYRGTPIFDRNFSGVDADVRAIVYVKDDIEIPISGTTDTAGGAEATRVYIQDGTPGTPEKLAVYTSKAEQNGKIRLHCENFHG